MDMEKSLEKVQFKEIKGFNSDEASLDAVCFIGTPFKNTNVKDKIFLSSNLFSIKKVFYEFSIKDIIKFEEIDNIVNVQGNSYSIYKVWVKKGAKALKHEPFIIE